MVKLTPNSGMNHFMDKGEEYIRSKYKNFENINSQG